MTKPIISMGVTPTTINRWNRMSARWRGWDPLSDPSWQQLMTFLTDMAADAMVGKRFPRRAFQAQAYHLVAEEMKGQEIVKVSRADTSRMEAAANISLANGLWPFYQQTGMAFTGRMGASIRKVSLPSEQGEGRLVGFIPQDTAATPTVQNPAIYIRALHKGVPPSRISGLGRGRESVRVPRIAAWITAKQGRPLTARETKYAEERGVDPTIIQAWKLIKWWETNRGIVQKPVFWNWWRSRGPVLRIDIARACRAIVEAAMPELLRKPMER